MRRFLALFLILVLIVGGYSLFAFSRSMPLLRPVDILPTLSQTTPPNLTWPAYGQAAVGASGYGLLASHGAQKPMPTASVAKIMTALAVLKKHPLKLGEQGPTLVMGDQDVAFYNQYVAQEGSVVPINYGEEISEYQALQAMLLPSANNMASSLTVWAYGSEKAYVAFANNYARQLGMRSTHISDASGFLPTTTSSANDLVSLGLAALKQPVLAQIVSQSTADVPVAGTIYNVNELVGQNGINGIKTGNTDQAGGVYLASATYQVAGKHNVTVVTAIMGAPNLLTAMDNTLPLLSSSQAGFVESTIIKQGQVVGYYNTPWHTSTNAIAAYDVTAFGWSGKLPKPKLSIEQARVPARQGQTVGTLRLAGSAPTAVTLQQSVPDPSWKWRLLHP